MRTILLATLVAFLAPLFSPTANCQVRIPAEWEPHEATWMQWPRYYESSYRPSFAEIIRALQAYEPVRIVAHNNADRNQARNFLQNAGVPLNNVTFHIMPLDNAWMRDNGPVWADYNGQLIVEDWGFDGWGGLAGPYYTLDDAIPPQVAAVEGVPSYDLNVFVHERGNLEFNGTDTVILNWSCWSDRNPFLNFGQSQLLLRLAFGVQKVVWLFAVPEEDVTGGHVDGIARFINEDTVVIPEYWDPNHTDAPVYEEAATLCQRVGLNVIRMPVQGEVMYRGVPMAANYVNWLVANGAVIMPGFNHPAWDAAAKQAVEGYFPGRTVHVIDTRELWYWGGSVHCVTNDQPALNP